MNRVYATSSHHACVATLMLLLRGCAAGAPGVQPAMILTPARLTAIARPSPLPTPAPTPSPTAFRVPAALPPLPPLAKTAIVDRPLGGVRAVTDGSWITATHTLHRCTLPCRDATTTRSWSNMARLPRAGNTAAIFMTRIRIRTSSTICGMILNSAKHATNCKNCC